MAEKLFDLYLSYEDADSESVLKLALRLINHQICVFVPQWELAHDELTPTILGEVILQSAAVGICMGTSGLGTTGLRDATAAKAQSVECFSIDLSADEDVAFQSLAAALAKLPPRKLGSPGDNRSVVDEATMILRGELPPNISEPIKLIKALRALKKIGIARHLLERCRLIYRQELTGVQRLWMGQQHALCTYKDPDLPADKKFDTALAILREVDDLKTTTDQETLGLAGAIYKYRYEALGQKPDLERSLGYYLRGHAAGPKNDHGYTSINAAYVLDLIARQEADDGRQSGTVSQTAEDRKTQARIIRSELVEVLPPMQYEQGKRYLARQWWFHATVAEALFGLARFNDALYWLQKGTGQGVAESWEFESTARQLASIARLQVDGEWNMQVMESSQAWATVKAFLGSDEAGVRSVFLGRVGLALSGGGFRASLFHIGVLARLAELDVLRHVEVLSCVSGGSIIGAHYYLELRRLLQSKSQADITRADYITMVQRIERDFLSGVQRNIRMRMLASFSANFKMFLPMFFPNFSRTEHTGKLLETEIFSRIQDQDVHGQRERNLNRLTIKPIDEPQDQDFSPKDQNWRRAVKVPILVLNATSLNTGHNWQFTATWMGEPPGGVDSKVDANYRLRRMYYRQAPLRYQDFPLGHAVAASAAVPGLFEPLNLPNLYPGKKVCLVDGGVHDNQGTASLLEQGCLVMLVSDASGQMDSVDNPGGGVLSTLLRSNSVLQARIRLAQYHDLEGRLTSSLLRSFMFLHMKKDVESDPVDWERCQDPIQTSPNNVLASFGILKTVQRSLADVRTDLDSFHDVEAFALMTSGYRMAERWFMDSKRHSFPKVDPVDTAWRFLAVEGPMKNAADGWERQHDKLMKLLKVSNCLAFKVWKLKPSLKVMGVAILVIALLLILLAAFWAPTVEIITLRSLIVTALTTGAVYLFGENLVRVVRFRDTLQRMLLGIGMCFGGILVAWLHLWVFDRIYLDLGRVGRLRK